MIHGPAHRIDTLNKVLASLQYDSTIATNFG
jgi:hypothetical protein